jgi:uncharacterized integral membrane protein
MTRPFRYLSWIVTIPLAFVAISFAVSNREPTVLKLWPLPFEVEMAVFLPVLGALVAGFVAGGAMAWWYGGRYRRLARRQSSRLKNLTAEMESLRAREAGSAEAASQPLKVTAQREEAAPRRLAAHDSR